MSDEQVLSGKIAPVQKLENGTAGNIEIQVLQGLGEMIGSSILKPLSDAQIRVAEEETKRANLQATRQDGFNRLALLSATLLALAIVAIAIIAALKDEFNVAAGIATSLVSLAAGFLGGFGLGRGKQKAA